MQIGGLIVKAFSEDDALNVIQEAEAFVKIVHQPSII